VAHEELETIWKETFVAYLKVLSLHSSGVTEENCYSVQPRKSLLPPSKVKVYVKLSLYCEHHTMKAYGEWVFSSTHS
jgi:hypothetical protein